MQLSGSTPRHLKVNDRQQYSLLLTARSQAFFISRNLDVWCANFAVTAKSQIRHTLGVRRSVSYLTCRLCSDASVLRVNVRQAPLFDAEMQGGPTAAVPAEIMGGGT